MLPVPNGGFAGREEEARNGMTSTFAGGDGCICGEYSCAVSSDSITWMRRQLHGTRRPAPGDCSRSSGLESDRACATMPWRVPAHTAHATTTGAVRGE